MPIFIDQKMIDELGFSWTRRSFCKFFFVAQRIDKRGLTHIGSANKCVFRQSALRAFGDFCVADYKTCRFDLHGILELS
jgi:hypothetical protein